MILDDADLGALMRLHGLVASSAIPQLVNQEQMKVLLRQIASNGQCPTARSDMEKIGLIDSVVAEIDARSEDTVVGAALDGIRRELVILRNSLVNINTLPDEILRGIFLAASGPRVEEKLSLFQTCARWRAVCVGFAGYWTDIYIPASIANAGGLALVLENTRDLPLSVEVSEYLVFQTQFDKWVLPRADRVTRLKAPFHLLRSYRTLFPALRNLQIEQLGEPQYANDTLSPELVLRGALKEVSLLRCRFPYSSASYRGIRVLSIVYKKDDWISPTFGDLAHVIRTCMDLEDLTLHHPPMSRSEVISARPSLECPISLLSLRRLDLRMQVYNLSAMLTRLETTEALTHVTLVALSPTLARGHDPADIGRGGAGRGSLLALPSSECLPMIAQADCLSIRNVLGNNPPGYYIPQPGLDARAIRATSSLSIAFGHDGRDDHIMQAASDNFVRSLLRHHPSCSTRTLELRHAARYASGLLRVTTNLRTLIISENHIGPIVDALALVKPWVSNADGDKSFAALDIIVSNCFFHQSCELDELAAPLGAIGAKSLVFEGCSASASHFSIRDIIRYLGRDGLHVRWSR
ncbi:hypothetical protein C8Q76DRAFT_709081 [Earliella scabrosa]|nr:hypothetical protein C8Q76DRAFT_709081 [Earliella scabrosa]